MSRPKVSINSLRNNPIAAALRITTRCSCSRMTPRSGRKSRSSASCNRSSSGCGGFTMAADSTAILAADIDHRFAVTRASPPPGRGHA